MANLLSIAAEIWGSCGNDRKDAETISFRWLGKANLFLYSDVNLCELDIEN
jgi:hypothetical protein